MNDFSDGTFRSHEVTDPSRLDGLEPLRPGTELVIAEIGLNIAADYKESLTIVAGSGSGGSGFFGVTAPYERDVNIETFCIVDVSDFPIYVQDEGGPLHRVNFIAISYQGEQLDGVPTGNRIPVVTKLLPGEQHRVANRAGVELGSFGVDDAGALHVVRAEDPEGQGNIRIVSNTEGYVSYTQRPALERVDLTVKLVSTDVQQPILVKPSGDDDLVLDPGYRDGAVDSATGEVTISSKQRGMVVPFGQPGRWEQRIAHALFKRQEEQDYQESLRSRAAAPRYRTHQPPR